MEAVLALGKILADKNGRDFVLGLGRRQAELCMEVSDYVSHNLHSPFHRLIQFVRASQNMASSPPRSKLSSSR